MNRVEVLLEAGRVIDGDRDEAYGAPEDNWGRVAGMWSVILNTPVTPHEAALCMIAVKLSRLVNTPGHDDSWVDIAGYAALGCEIS